MYQGVEIPGHTVSLCLNFREGSDHSPMELDHFTFLPAVYDDSNFSKSLPTLVIVFLSIAITAGVKWYLTVALISIYLILVTLSIFLAICIFPLEKCLFRSLAHFLNWAICLFITKL